MHHMDSGDQSLGTRMHDIITYRSSISYLLQLLKCSSYFLLMVFLKKWFCGLLFVVVLLFSLTFSSLTSLNLKFFIFVVLSGGQFCFPQGTLDSFQRCFQLSQLGRCYWHLVGRDQRYCQVSYSAHSSPLPQRSIWAKMFIMLRWRNPGLDDRQDLALL